MDGGGRLENSSKLIKREVENLIAGLGFLWYNKIEYKEAEEIWVAITQ